MMKEKLDSLYALPLSLSETSSHIDWYKDPYTMESFKEEMSALNKNELCKFLLDIASEGVLECSILRFALRVFQEISERYFISEELNNQALNHVIIEKTKIGSADLINVIHVIFKESVIVPEDYYGFIIESMAVGERENLMLKYEKIVQKDWLLTALAPIHDGQRSLNHLILMYSKQMS